MIQCLGFRVQRFIFMIQYIELRVQDLKVMIQGMVTWGWRGAERRKREREWVGRGHKYLEALWSWDGAVRQSTHLKLIAPTLTPTS